MPATDMDTEQPGLLSGFDQLPFNEPAPPPNARNDLFRVSRQKTVLYRTDTGEASFNSLPPELRNAIYELALRQSKRIFIGFKYDVDLPKALQVLGRPKTQRRGVRYPFMAIEMESVKRTTIVESIPPLATALPLLKREVMSMHYSENGFRVSLCNTVERRLFRDWALQRGPMLRELASLSLVVPRARHRWGPLSVELFLNDSGGVEVACPQYVAHHYRPCTCDFVDVVAQRLSSGRARSFDCVRTLDVGPVVESALAFAEAMELAEMDWAALIAAHCTFPVPVEHQQRFCPTCWNAECSVCGRDHVYIL